MTQKVLPHNVAWPFFPFLPSWYCPLFVAILCGRKSPMARKMAPMLKQRVLTDNMAPQIFFSPLARKPVAKKFLGVSPYYASAMATACRENPDICARICLVTYAPNTQKSWLLAWNIVRKSLKHFAPYYEAPIRHESCQTTVAYINCEQRYALQHKGFGGPDGPVMPGLSTASARQCLSASTLHTAHIL